MGHNCFWSIVTTFLLGDNINTTKGSIEALLDTSNKAGLEVMQRLQGYSHRNG